MTIKLYKNDLPLEFIESKKSFAIDTETMGLCPYRDRLCLAQFADEYGEVAFVQFDTFDKAKNIQKILEDNSILKIFHYARFDMMMIFKYLGFMTTNVYCTKIASKLSRTYTQKHSLLELCKELLNIEISKEQTCTDWGKQDLTEEQKQYAANDVLYLHKIKDILDSMLVRENRLDIAKACFYFLSTRIKLDLMVGENYDIFSHSS